MKKITLAFLAAVLMAIIFLPNHAYCQSPQKMSYQSVIRNATDELVTESTVGIQISIIQGTPTGTATYVETHAPMTNINGLASLEIGMGTPVTGTFADIDWANGPFFIKTETDPAGGTSYSLTGTSELLSVPYALHAGDDGDWAIEGDTLKTNKQVGIGAANPGADLHLKGEFILEDGTEGEGLVLKSDENGKTTWGNIGGSALLPPGVGAADFSCMGEVGSVSIFSAPTAMVTADNHLYVLEQITDVMLVYNIDEPDDPILVTSISISNNPSLIAYSNNKIAIGSGVSNILSVVDVSDPTSPTLEGTLSLGDAPREIAAGGNFVFITSLFSSELKIIDISNPATPIEVASPVVSSAPKAVTVANKYVYVTDSSLDELNIIDVNDPTSPVIVGTLDVTGNPNSVVIDDDILYIAETEGNDLITIDVSDPTAPTLLGELNFGLTISPSRVKHLGEYVFVLSIDEEMIHAVNVSNPSAPILENTLTFNANDLNFFEISGNYAYVTDINTDELIAIQLDCAGSSELTFNPLSNEVELQTPNWQIIGDNIFNANSGRVGLGTSMPTNRLSVNGTANNGTGSWGVFSDKRIKKVKGEFSDGLNIITQIQPIRFDYNENAPFDVSGEQIGVIAQELEMLAPYMVTISDHPDIENLREVNNQAYVFLLINAIKEQQQMIEKLQKENREKTKSIEEISAQLDENTKLLQELNGLLKAQSQR